MAEDDLPNEVEDELPDFQGVGIAWPDTGESLDPAPQREPGVPNEPRPSMYYLIEQVVEKFGEQYNSNTGFEGEGSAKAFNVTPQTVLDLLAFVGTSETGRLWADAEALASEASEGEGGEGGFWQRNVFRHVPLGPGSTTSEADRFPDQDITVQMLRLVAAADPKRFEAVWTLFVGDRNASVPGYRPSEEQQTIYRRWLDGNADPQILAQAFGFDPKTVDQGGTFENSVYEAPDGSIESRANILGIYAQPEDIESVREILFPKTISQQDIDEKATADAQTGAQDLLSRQNTGLYEEETVRKIQRLVGGVMPFDKSSITTSADLGGWLNDQLLGIRQTDGSFSGGMGQEGQFYGEKLVFTDSADIFGSDKALLQNNLYGDINTDLEANFGGGFGMSANVFAPPGFESDSSLVNEALGGGSGGIIEPAGGDPLIGASGSTTLGRASRAAKSDSQENYDQWRFKLYSMSDAQIEDVQRALWSMNYFGEDGSAIRNGSLPNWGFLDEETQRAYAKFGLDIFTSDSLDASVVGAQKRREAMPLFDELRANLTGIFDGERAVVDRAAVTAEFDISSDETLEGQIQEIARGVDGVGGVGERLTSSQMQAIKSIIRGAESSMIDQSFGQQQAKADQAYERQRVAALRQRYDSATGGGVHYDEFGNPITYNRNPTGGEHPGRKFTDNSQGGILAEPVTDKDGNVFQPGALDLSQENPAFRDPGAPLNQADSFVEIERVDPEAIIRAQLRKTRGDDVFARSMGSAVNVLRNLIAGG
jgi:hypothetical protein